MDRAYAFLHIKSIDPIKRTLVGMATTPDTDRAGDIIEPLGVAFKNPLPLLLHHDSRQPIGQTHFGKPTKAGVPFTAQLSTVDRPGAVKDRIDEAWDSLSADPPLITGVSIGFRAIEPPAFNADTGGFRFTKTEVLELSLVVVPANAGASISAIKSFDTQPPAATGTAARVTASLPGAAGFTRSGQRMTIQEQIKQFEASRQAKATRLLDMMAAVSDKGETLDESASQEYDGLEADVKSIDRHLVRLSTADAMQKASAVQPQGHTPEAASTTRALHQVSVQQTLPPGYGLARATMCKIASFVAMQKGEIKSALDFARERYPDDSRLQLYVKATIAPGTTTDATWAGALVDPTNYTQEFLEYLRPQTIIGKISGLTRVPFNVRIIGQTSGGTAYWVGQAKPKPLTKFDFAPTTLGFAKVAAISVISEELARFSSPSAEQLVRDALVKAVIARIDTDFIDPDVAAVANVSPASITNGIAPIPSTGTDAATIRTDLKSLLSAFITANVNPSGLVLIMSNQSALAAAMMINALGQPEFPTMNMNGGTLNGIPVITSQYAANTGASGTIVVAVNAPDIFLADDGSVTVDVSREASLEMLDSTFVQAAPTGANLVSMWQNNLIALRAERYITWARARASAVSWLSDVDWGGTETLLMAAQSKEAPKAEKPEKRT